MTDSKLRVLPTAPVSTRADMIKMLKATLRRVKRRELEGLCIVEVGHDDRVNTRLSTERKFTMIGALNVAKTSIALRIIADRCVDDDDDDDDDDSG